VVLLSAIARPASFFDTVTELGAEVVRDLRYRDHHRFTKAEAEAAVAIASDKSALLVTTEKDDAKLQAFGIERHVLRIDLRFLDGEPEPSELML
jgi:tetraacyldisaccharide 4'-kinase